MLAGFSAPAHLAAMLPLLAADGRPFSNGRSERTREALRKAEVAHAGLLARCNLAPDEPQKRLEERRKRTPGLVQQRWRRDEASEGQFFAKELRVWEPNGLPIRAHEAVPDAALYVAQDRVSRMLRQQPKSVKQRLTRSGAAIHIVGRRQQVSDLPEHSHLKGRRGDYAHEATEDPRRIERYGVWAEKSLDGRGFRLPLFSAESLTIDERTRGMGGLQASCGEENLLSLDVDPRYAGRDILSHECAHTLMDFGLTGRSRAAIEAQYNESVVERGLWRRPDGSKAYAATNPSEYFAELTMWLFGSHGEYVDAARRLPAPGPVSLAWYDPGGFQLVGSIYEGTHPSLRPAAAGSDGDGEEEAEEARRDGPPRRLMPVEAAAISEDEQGLATEIRIHGSASKPLSIAWINEMGERISYGGELGIPPGGIFTQRTFPGHVWEVGFAAAAELKAGTGDASAPGTSTSDQRAPRGIVRRYRVANGSPIQVIQAAEDLRSSAECLDELV